MRSHRSADTTPPPRPTGGYGMGGVRGGMAPIPRVHRRKHSKTDDKQVSASVVAQQAVRRLELPSPVIHTSPDEDFEQVVRVPTWLWVEGRSWGPVTKSAEVDGLKVTATARPRKAVWEIGDGHSVTCEGPGTPYSKKYGAKASSPDCGYIYHTASRGRAGGKFTVRVTVTWDVEWKGGGHSGRVPGLTKSAERPLIVDEVQSVVKR